MCCNCIAVCKHRYTLELLHQRCDIMNVRICKIQCVFSGKWRFRCEEKLARVCDGCGHRRSSTESVSAFSLLCWHCAIVLCDSVSPGRSGMAASRFLAAAAVCVVLWSFFAAESQKSYCSGCMRVANAALALMISFQNFFYKCFKIAIFPLWRRDPVSELQFV